MSNEKQRHLTDAEIIRFKRLMENAHGHVIAMLNKYGNASVSEHVIETLQGIENTETLLTMIMKKPVKVRYAVYDGEKDSKNEYYIAEVER